MFGSLKYISYIRTVLIIKNSKNGKTKLFRNNGMGNL